jgi:YD repeat-containing protein
MSSMNSLCRKWISGSCARRSHRSARLMAVVLWAAIAILAETKPVSAQTVNYVYDGASRLTCVSDPSGNTAVYSYDLEGNVLSITRGTGGCGALAPLAATSPSGASVAAPSSPSSMVLLSDGSLTGLQQAPLQSAPSSAAKPALPAPFSTPSTRRGN